MKILPEMCLWTRENRLNFGRHQRLNQDLRIFFKKDSPALRNGAYFHNGPHICGEKLTADLHENFIVGVSLDKEIPTKFWKSIRIRSSPWRRSALLRVLLLILRYQDQVSNDGGYQHCRIIAILTP